MNIFTKAIITTNNDIKNAIIERLGLNIKPSPLAPLPKVEGEFQVYQKQDIENSVILIYSANKDFESVVNYIKDNYEALKVVYLGNSIAIDNVDLMSGDVIIPNSIENTDNKAVFFETIIDKNYDLKKFGLILNGLCLTLNSEIKDEEELHEIMEHYAPDIIDDEVFILSEKLEKSGLKEISTIIKIIGKENDYIENGVGILELML